MEKIIAGNFKMNKTMKECRDYAIRFSRYKIPKNKRVILCPPAYALENFSLTFKKTVHIGSQNVSSEEKGAFTGELSADMIKSTGASYTIIGHSERRQKLGETDEQVNLKATLAIKSGLVPIICVGETLDEMNKKKSVLSNQIAKAIKGLKGEYIIAYEPIWAIGTGKTCDLKNIEYTNSYIKEKVEKLTGHSVKVLYGGSVKPINAKSILESKLVDGVLVGGACLDPEEFHKIVIS